MNKLILIKIMNVNTLGNIFAAGVIGGLLFTIVTLYRHYKHKKSDKGKLEKKILKKKSALSEISKLSDDKTIINKDLIKSKKEEISKEIENDILHYQLKTNKEFISLNNFKKQGILDEASYNQAVENLKNHIKNKTNDKIKFIELDDGETLKVEQYLNESLKNSKLLTHLDIYNNKLIRSANQILYIKNNTIKNVFKEQEYKNGFLFAQQKFKITSGDILLKPVNYSKNELIILNSACAIKIKDNIVTMVYWIKKGETLKGKRVEIFQKDSNKRNYNDLVFIDSLIAKDGFHIITIHGSFSILRTKNGKIA